MTCEELLQKLSLYVDDCVSLPARVAIDEHLDRCPVCRSEAAELRSLTRSLKSMTRPVVPAGLADSITDLLTIEDAARRTPKPSLGVRVARFLEVRLMPYTVGSFASLIMFFSMLNALRPHFVALREAALQHSAVLVVQTSTPGYDVRSPITPEVLEAIQANVSSELSPTLDPGGALAVLTRRYPYSHAGYRNDDTDADDMILVADVFSNGAASLVDVVQPPRDMRRLVEFESALRETAAFVPASYDRRPDTMRVVITLGPKVEVDAVDAQKF